MHLHRIQRKVLSQLEISVSFLWQPPSHLVSHLVAAVPFLSTHFYEIGDVLYDNISGQPACTVRWRGLENAALLETARIPGQRNAVICSQKQ